MSTPDEELRRRFGQLRHDWLTATAFESSITSIVLDISYQRIISLGPDAVPLILADLAARPGHWFWALKVLTGNDEARGEITMEGARQIWLDWGRRQGLLAREGALASFTAKLDANPGYQAALLDAESESWDGPGTDGSAMIEAADERRQAREPGRDPQ